MFGRDCFDQHHPTFFFRNRVVHRAFWDDVQIAGVEFYFFTFELNHETPTHDQKKFVFVFVVVPRQFAFYLRNLHVLIINTTDHFRRPVICNLAEALLKIDFHRKIIAEMPFDLQPILKGDLLELRPLRADDFEQLYAVASDPLIWEQHPSSDRYKPDVFRNFFDEAMQSGGALIALDHKNDQVIGSSRFHTYDLERSEIEIGWTFLARSHWGGVYNGEMKRLMLSHAFKFVDHVIFVIGVNNLRSQRAVEKIGGVRAGSKTDPHGRENFIFRINRSWLRGSTMRDELVTRFWFEFDLSGENLRRFPYFPAYGIGITAYDYHDALRLLRKWVIRGDEMPPIIDVIEDVDISRLEQEFGPRNLRLGCPVWRGVWHPPVNLFYGPDNEL